MNKFRLKLRVIFAVILISAVFRLLWLAVVPSGKVVYIRDFSKNSGFIENLTPADRVEAPAGGKQKIIGAPVYFILKVPRKFTKARLTLKCESEENTPLIEAGVLIDKTVWQYDLKPIKNKIIDGLAEYWDVFKKDGLVLLQRKDLAEKYESIKDFLTSPPDFKKVALYNYNFDADIFLADYEPKNSLKIIEDDFVGAYQFFTYLKDEDLYFNFVFADVNKSQGKDPISLIVYYKDKQIDGYYLEDDGETGDWGKETDEKNLKLELKNLPEGFYKIGFRASDDIITKKIETKQEKLAFINKINLGRGDALAGEKKIYTDSRQIQVKTIYPDRLGTLLIKEILSPRSSYADEININETYKQFESKKIKSALAEIIIENDGIVLAGDGVFSFNFDSLVNPGFKKVDANLEVDEEGIDYILANYDFLPPDGGGKEASAEFDLNKAYFKDNEYNFIISIPGLKADDETDDYIEIDEIKVELEGKSLFEKVRKIFN